MHYRSRPVDSKTVLRFVFCWHGASTFSMILTAFLFLAINSIWQFLLLSSVSPVVVQAQLIVRNDNRVGFKLGGRSNTPKALSLKNIAPLSQHNEHAFRQCETPNTSFTAPAAVMEGGTLELRCSLTPEFSSFGMDGIQWEFTFNEMPVRKLSHESDGRVQISQTASTSTLRIKNVREVDSGTYQCVHETASDLKLPYVCSRSVAVGGPPVKYVNLTCESLGFANFTCQWERGDDFMAVDSSTMYKFFWKSTIMSTAGGECTDLWRSDDARHWACLKGINQNNDEVTKLPNFYRHFPMTFVISGKNVFGQQNWSIPEKAGAGNIKASYYVRPLPPAPRALSLNTSAILVSWPKEEYVNNEVFAFFQLQMRSEYDLIDGTYPSSFGNSIENLPNEIVNDSTAPAMRFVTNKAPLSPSKLTVTKDRVAYVSDADDSAAIMTVGADEKWTTVTEDPHENIFTGTNMTIAGLRPYTLYQFRLRSHPIVDGYWSQFSGIVSNRTEATKPERSVAPIPGAFDFVSRNVTHLSMTVYWSDLPPWHRNGPDFHYDVTYMPLKRTVYSTHAAGRSGKQLQTVSLHHQELVPIMSQMRLGQANGPNFTLAYELGQRYQLIIRPVNRLGESAVSTTIVVEKNEAVQMTRITVVKLPTAPNVYTITIRWMVTGTTANAAKTTSSATNAAVSNGSGVAAGRTKRQTVLADGFEQVPGDESAPSSSTGRALYNVINATIYYCLASSDPTPASTEHTCISHLISKVIPLSFINQRERKLQTLLQLKTGNNLKYQFAVGVSAVAAAENNARHTTSSPVVYSGLKWATCLIMGDRQMPEFNFVDYVATENATLQISWRLKCEDRAELIEGYKIYVILCPPDQNIDKPSYCAQVLGVSLHSLPQTDVVAEHHQTTAADSNNPSSNAPEVAAVISADRAKSLPSLSSSSASSSPHSAAVITEEESLFHNYASLNNSFAVLLKINDRTSFAVKGLLPLRKYVVAVATVNPDGTESEPRLGKLIVETTELLWLKDPTHDNTIMILGIMLGLFFAFVIVTCACCWKRFRKVYREAKAEFRNIKLPEPSLVQMSSLASSARAAAAAANAENGINYATAAGKHSIANDNYYAQIPGADGAHVLANGYVDAQRLASGGGIAPATAGILSRQLSAPINGYEPAGVERMYITRFEDPEETDEEEEEKVSTEEEQKQLSEDNEQLQGDGERLELIRRTVSCAVPHNNGNDDEGEIMSMTVLLTRSKSSTGGAVDKSEAASQRVISSRTPFGGAGRAHSTAYSPLAAGNAFEMANAAGSGKKRASNEQLPVRRLGQRLRSFGARAAATLLSGGSSNGLAGDNRKTSESTAQRSAVIGMSSLAARSEPHISETFALETLYTAATAAGGTASAADVNDADNTERSCVWFASDADEVPLLAKTSLGAADDAVPQQQKALDVVGAVEALNSAQPILDQRRSPAPPPVASADEAADTGKDPQSKVVGWLATSRDGKKKRSDTSGSERAGGAEADDISSSDDVPSNSSPQEGRPELPSDAYQDAAQLLTGKSNSNNGVEFTGGTSLDECYVAIRGPPVDASVDGVKSEKPKRIRKKSSASNKRKMSTSSSSKNLPEAESNLNLHPNAGVAPRKACSTSPTQLSHFVSAASATIGMDDELSSPLLPSHASSFVETETNKISGFESSGSHGSLLRSGLLSLSNVEIPTTASATSVRSPVLSPTFNGANRVVTKPVVMPAVNRRDDAESAYVLRSDAPPDVVNSTLRDGDSGMMQPAFPNHNNNNGNFQEAENGYILEPRTR